MALPVSQGYTARAFNLIVQAIVDARNESIAVQAAIPNSPPRTLVISYMSNLTRQIDVINSLRTTPGLQQYARDQWDDQTLDVPTEFTAVLSAMTQLRDWIFANFPKGGGAWQVYDYDNAGVPVVLTFTPAQLSDLDGRITTFLGTVS